MSRRQTQLDQDRLGFDQTRNYTTEIFGKLLPRPVVQRAVRVSIRTDADRYRLGEPVEITLEFKNRLPVPVTLYTPSRRLWGWTIDDYLEASSEPRYVDNSPGKFSFRGGERKTVDITWDGRIKHAGEPDVWKLPEPGQHTLTGFIATENRPEDSVDIELVRG